MDRVQAKIKVYKLLSETISDFDTDVDSKSLLKSDLGIDSIDAVDIVIQLENETFSIVSDDEFKNWETIDDIIDQYVKQINR